MPSGEHELVKPSCLIDLEEFNEEWGKLFGGPWVAGDTDASDCGTALPEALAKLSDEKVLESCVGNPYWRVFIRGATQQS